CAPANNQKRRIAIKSLNRKVFRVTVATEDSHRLEGALLSGLGREQLRHSRLKVAALAAVFFLGRRVNQQSRRFDLCSHVGELQLNRLMLADGLSESAALLRILDRIIERSSPDSKTTRGTVETLPFKSWTQLACA